MRARRLDPLRARSTWSVMVVLALAVLLGQGRPGSSDGPAPKGERPLHERVNEAIDRGVAWLLARGKPLTVEKTEVVHWGLIGGEKNYLGGANYYPYPAGLTALALYTLLKCEVPPTHPVIQQGFAWLQVRHAVTPENDGIRNWDGKYVTYREPFTSYEISATLLALTAKHVPEKRSADAAKRAPKIADKADRAWAEALVAALIARRGSGSRRDPPTERGWRYNQVYRVAPPPDSAPTVIGALASGNEDLSSTQLATLALFAASRLGVDVPPAVWTDIATYTLDQQEEKGPDHPRFVPAGSQPDRYASKDQARGWAYLRASTEALEKSTSGAMTACGVANLLMARQGIGVGKAARKAWDAQKLDARVEKAVNDGLAWLDKNWSNFRNPGVPTYYYDTYYLYALERAMDLMGRELVGGHTWYVEGAEQLLRRTKAATVKRLLDDKGGETDGVFWEEKNTHPPYDLLDTCFALLFLKRSTKSLAAVTPGG